MFEWSDHLETNFQHIRNHFAKAKKTHTIIIHVPDAKKLVPKYTLPQLIQEINFLAKFDKEFPFATISRICDAITLIYTNSPK